MFARPLPEPGEEITITLDEFAGEGARSIIAAALRAEADEYVAQFADVVDEDGHRLVVRIGRAPERKVTVGAGTVPIWARVAAFICGRYQALMIASPATAASRRLSLSAQAACALADARRALGHGRDRQLASSTGHSVVADAIVRSAPDSSIKGIVRLAMASRASAGPPSQRPLAIAQARNP